MMLEDLPGFKECLNIVRHLIAKLFQVEFDRCDADFSLFELAQRQKIIQDTDQVVDRRFDAGGMPESFVLLLFTGVHLQQISGRQDGT